MEHVRVRAWQNVFPERDELPALFKRTNNVGIAFSGGGARAMIAAVGQLAALHELGLLSHVRYITGISGGSWATAAYSFAVLGANGTARDDDELLTAITDPEKITNTTLAQVNPKSMRHLAMDFGPLGPFGPNSQRRRRSRRRASDEGDHVTNHIYNWLLKPVGVPGHAAFSWSEATVADIRGRNPRLVNMTFVLPSSQSRPFPILGFSLLGPTRLAPFEASAHASQMLLLEATPLYVGSATVTRNQTYHSHHAHSRPPYNLTIGGFVEPFAFGGMAPPLTGLPAGATRGLLDVPLPPQAFALENATFASSNFPAEALATIDLPWIDDAVSLSTGYWSPHDAAPRAEESLLGDGGDLENIHLFGLLQRGVESIVLFLNAEGTLHDQSVWDPAKTAPRSDVVTDYLSPFFGVACAPADEVEKWEDEYAVVYTANQAFPKEDFVPLVQKLQAAQAAGGGVVVTTPHVTVANARWGLEAGIQVNVTWVYLSRVGMWEQRLSPSMAAKVVPKPPKPPQPIDYGSTIQGGEFDGFPNMPTTNLDYTPGQTNMLADLTGWTVKHNAATFLHALA